MQTIKLDLSIHRKTDVLRVKQLDVGRKFRVELTDNGADWPVPANVTPSLWYFTPSGKGNYSANDMEGSFTVDGNSITVELVAQMLTNYGHGALSLVLNDAAGTQLGLWSICLEVEELPGANSEAVQEYYISLSEAASRAASSAAEAKLHAEAAQRSKLESGVHAENAYESVVEAAAAADHATAAANQAKAAAEEIKNTVLTNISWDDLKDKPFGEVAAGTVVFEDTVTTDERNIVMVPQFEIIPGVAYAVAVDGTAYTAKAGGYLVDGAPAKEITVINDALEAVISFNNHFLEGNTVIGFPAAGTYALRVATAEAAVKKLDPAYIPGNLDSALPAPAEATDVFPEMDVLFTYNQELGVAELQISPAPYVLTAGDTYFVVVDGVAYKCKAMVLEGVACIGDDRLFANGSFTGAYPFLIGYIPDIADGVDAVIAYYNSNADITVKCHIYQCPDEGKVLGIAGGEYVLLEQAAEPEAPAEPDAPGLPALAEATDLLPETDVSFTYSSTFGAAAADYAPAPYALTAGATYFVVADGVTYQCKATVLEGVVFMGDEGAISGTWTGAYPFAIGYDPDIGEGVDAMIALYNSSTDITVKCHIYQYPDDGKVLGVAGGDYVLMELPEMPVVPEVSSLPEVTAADEGKFLRVTGGTWAAAAVANAEEASF